MYLKQNNFYGQYNDAVECYVHIGLYVLNPIFNTLFNSTWIYTQHSDYSHGYIKVEVGYVYTPKLW